MTTKQEILDEIKRTATENGGKALGVDRFEGETGIKPYDWERFWARFGDAVKEAGFAPNQFKMAHPDGFLLEKLAGLVRKLGRLPTFREITVEGTNDPQFPNKKIFQRLGSKGQLAKKLMEFCATKDELADVATICSFALKQFHQREPASDRASKGFAGEVYLFKSGRYFKIGRTNDAIRRGSEIRIQLPEKVRLIHLIKTDDPAGVEAYWHKRFDSKRMSGEWFDLTPSDVTAFKRWRRIH